MQQNRDFLDREFAELVPQWTNKLLELFQRALVMDAEINNLNGLAANGESRRLQSIGYQQILANTKLLDLSGQPIWPPPHATGHCRWPCPPLAAGGDWHATTDSETANARREASASPPTTEPAGADARSVNAEAKSRT